eukprot:maker-scaffold990_size72856-snap-gene-0.13 protein:Tk06267 transcript:maker-scaffold990_size72856-snap-gene-0.13-mRNA-1 annotation:"ring finger and spry domain-containing protein 1-like"
MFRRCCQLLCPCLSSEVGAKEWNRGQSIPSTQPLEGTDETEATMTTSPLHLAISELPAEAVLDPMGLPDWLKLGMMGHGEEDYQRCLRISLELLKKPVDVTNLDFERQTPSEYEDVRQLLIPSDMMKEEFDLSLVIIQLIDRLIVKTLTSIRTLVDSEQEPPLSMMELNLIAEKESGWFLIIHAMLRCIPLENPLGPATISLLLDDCPLPTSGTMLRLCDQLHVVRQMGEGNENFTALHHKNVAIVLGFMAEKLAGSRCQQFFSEEILAHFVHKLRPDEDPSVVLYSLLALEKFAQTSENKLLITRYFEREFTSQGLDTPLIKLESSHRASPQDLTERQVAFCVQWCLDNIFIQKERPFSYLGADMKSYNVILNANDVSEYLKIGPTGLEARSDALSFESIRCTSQVRSGIWYYEATVITSGIMQIGWAAKDSKFLNHDGYGIGDDEYSVAFDGCRQLLWHGAHSYPIQEQITNTWSPGDVMGTTIDFERRELRFWLNGQGLAPVKWLFEDWRTEAQMEYFPAASFMSFQQCAFNFGAEPFRFPPPDCGFKALNDNPESSLSEKEKQIIPRHIKLEAIRQVSINENACSICFDQASIAVIKPCDHAGFCETCARQLEVCPYCRAIIQSIETKLTHEQNPSPSLETIVQLPNQD